MKVFVLFYFMYEKSVYAKTYTLLLHYKLFEIIFAAVKDRYVKIFAAFIEGEFYSAGISPKRPVHILVGL